MGIIDIQQVGHSEDLTKHPNVVLALEKECNRPVSITELVGDRMNDG